MLRARSPSDPATCSKNLPFVVLRGHRTKRDRFLFSCTRVQLTCSISKLEQFSDGLEFAFADRLIRDICEMQLRAEHALGLTVARSLRARLADLREASSPLDVVAGDQEILTSINPGRVRISLGEGFHLIYCANHVSNPVNDAGELRWNQVERIKILEVGVATHG